MSVRQLAVSGQRLAVGSQRLGLVGWVCWRLTIDGQRLVVEGKGQRSMHLSLKEKEVSVWRLGISGWQSAVSVLLLAAKRQRSEQSAVASQRSAFGRWQSAVGFGGLGELAVDD